jgi:hypothetical protein
LGTRSRYNRYSRSLFVLYICIRCLKQIVMWFRPNLQPGLSVSNLERFTVIFNDVHSGVIQMIVDGPLHSLTMPNVSTDRDDQSIPSNISVFLNIIYFKDIYIIKYPLFYRYLYYREYI